VPLLGFLIAENYLDFGGGDKDLALLIPWIIWAILFIGFGIWQWKKSDTYKKWIAKSFVYSVLVLFFLWGCLLAVSVVTSM